MRYIGVQGQLVLNSTAINITAVKVSKCVLKSKFLINYK